MGKVEDFSVNLTVFILKPIIWAWKFPKKHPIFKKIISGLLLILSWFVVGIGGVLIGAYLNFMYPSGVESLTGNGWHFAGIQITTFGFNFASFKTNYTQTDSTIQQIVVSNFGDNKLKPELIISGNPPEMNINCVEQSLRVKCNDGFPIPPHDDVTIDLNITMNYPPKKSYTLNFKVVQGDNYREDDVVILVY